MKPWSLFVSRGSIGWLLVLWGIDKLVNVDHSLAVADRFYRGVGATAWLLHAFGLLELALGSLVVLGLWRRVAYPAALLVLGITALAVWRSILDPWGWALDGTNALFYPSLIIFAGAVVLWAFREEDTLALDARRRAS